MDTVNKEEFKKSLEQFTGSMQLYEHRISDYFMTMTEGVKYVVEEVNAYWLADLILSYQWNAKVCHEEFQVWTLLKQKDESWTITCTDGNDRFILRQDISYSDFPLEIFRLWVVKGTIMLPSEY
jgi:hypothetical protein